MILWSVSFLAFRYCMDTIEAPPELRWRRKGMETCYECPPLKLTSVCMACARRCQRDRLLIPRVRPRSSKDICDCRISGLCRCKYSHVREQFDRLITPTTGFKDECIGPNLLRTLLEKCLHPMPLENSDMEECLINLSEGDETAEVPRITAWNFENWYDQHFKRKPHIWRSNKVLQQFIRELLLLLLLLNLYCMWRWGLLPFPWIIA